MVQNIMKKEEEEALKILKGGKSEKKETRDEKSKENNKAEPKNIENTEEEIFSEFVPSTHPSGAVSPLLPVEKKRLEEHAAEAELPKKKEDNKEEIKYSAPMYGERGYEERLSMARETNERGRAAEINREGNINMGKRPEIRMFNPSESMRPGARDSTTKYEVRAGTAESGSGLPFMRKDDAKKYRKR